MTDESPDYNLAVIRDLILDAFDPDSFRQLFFFSNNLKLKPVFKLFSPSDNLPLMAARTIAFCEQRLALPDLLEAIKKANPYQYGRYEERLRRTTSPEPAIPDAQERQFEPLHIDPDDPPIAAIRGLLLAAFTARGLHDFCQDRPDFRPLITRFGADLALDGMVAELIEYCSTQLLWDTLLAEVARVNPTQYTRFEPRLRQT